ncbi:hypothetical protein PAXRUDRAFT_801276 [Paxillus rubicundulus Ve08.2h10]|uniref:Uncharacterized protein n=1 Tax=Paxillus rubicundulus Ve08.2h10 TaxID=930991 RepID=A0A0D0DWP7_9AGAM|nr:hypothetical protein PAXRUDRAFT_801276 [Paxillus rubicundulus Ve08.2h10]
MSLHLTSVLTSYSAASLCGLTAGLYGAFKQRSPGKFFLLSAVNSGIAAATFFSIREYIVGPALALTLPGKQYRLSRHRLIHGDGGPTHDEPPLSWADIRTSRLLDSGISGAFAGGILNTWKRGRRGLVPGLATGALVCFLLQWTSNEFDIVRIHYLSQNSIVQNQHTAPSVGDAATSSLKIPRPSIPDLGVVDPVEVDSLTDRLLSMFGRRVSDDEYLKRLKVQRDSHLRRIAELEEERKKI